MINLHEIPELKRIDVDAVTYIRPLQSSDAEAVLAILKADPTIRERVAVAAKMINHQTIEQEVHSYTTSPDLIRYVIVYENTIVGMISLWSDGGYFEAEPVPNGYGFGYFLDPTRRGKGIISKTIKKLMITMQRVADVEAFLAYCEEDNGPSIAVLTSLGFIPTDKTFIEPQHNWMERRFERKI